MAIGRAEIEWAMSAHAHLRLNAEDERILHIIIYKLQLEVAEKRNPPAISGYKILCNFVKTQVTNILLMCMQ